MLHHCDDADMVAEALWQRYGEGARLQAALAAYQAIQREDLKACELWRGILDLLEEKVAHECEHH